MERSCCNRRNFYSSLNLSLWGWDNGGLILASSFRAPATSPEARAEAQAELWSSLSSAASLSSFKEHASILMIKAASDLVIVLGLFEGIDESVCVSDWLWIELSFHGQHHCLRCLLFLLWFRLRRGFVCLRLLAHHHLRGMLLLMLIKIDSTKHLFPRLGLLFFQ